MPRIRSALNLYVFAVLGAFLVAAPWTPVWEQATAMVPAASPWLRSGWARGVVSGLGALDLLVAGQEAAALWRSLWDREGTKG